MPSKRQQAATKTEYDSPAEKYLRGKNMRTVLALIQGIRRRERAREWQQTAMEVGVHERVESAIGEKLDELEG